MSAYVPSRPAPSSIEAGSRARSILVTLQELIRGVVGGPPIVLRGNPPAWAVVASLIGAYAVALAAFGSGAAAIFAAPTIIAAVVLSGPLAALAWLASVVVAVTIVPVHELSLTGKGLGAFFVLASALVLRAVVVAAVSSRTEQLRRDALRAVAQTEQRAAQVSVLQAASARLSRASSVEGVGRAIVEETRKMIDYHNARVYQLEPTGDVVPIAFEGNVGAYEQVDFALLRCRVGQGFTGWVAQHGVPLLINDANADPRGSNIPGTDDVEESMLVVPMRYDAQVVGVITLSKLGLDQFDEEDERLLLILADQAATALESARLLARSQALSGELRRLLDMSSQLSASLDSRQVANIMARHLASALGVDECAISYWDRPNQRLATLGYFPEEAHADLTPFFDVTAYPQTLRVLENQTTFLLNVDDPTADAAETALLRPHGHRALVMLPLVAKGQSIGLVELMSFGSIELDGERLELARTMANEAAMAMENARLYEDARALADLDQLTGFYNHRFLHERFGEEVVRAQRGHQPLSVLMLDLDDFKLVNDTFGHLFGDQVLAWASELIRSTLRASDIPARYGGDEFAILLPDTTAEGAARAANRVREAFATSTFAGGPRRPVAVSLAVGAATFPADGRSGTELIAAADARLYEEKRRPAEPPTAVPKGRRSRRHSDARSA